MKGSIGFGLPALQRQLELENRLNSLVQRVEWPSAAARTFEATNYLKDWGGIHQAYRNISPIMSSLALQWSVVDSMAQSVSTAIKAYPVDHIAQMQSVTSHLFPAIESINISSGIISDALKTSSMIPSMGVAESAIKGIEHANLALKALTAYPAASVMEGIVETVTRWQNFGDIITVDDVGSMLDDIEDITLNSQESKQSGIWDASKNQFFVGAALALMTLLWGIYTYFFPLTAAKEDELSKAQLILDEKKAAYLEMTAISEERQADALERIAAALEQQNEAESTKELLEDTGA